MDDYVKEIEAMEGNAWAHKHINLDIY
jgi:hypothetical protein